MSFSVSANRTSITALSCFHSSAGSLILHTFGITNFLLLLPLSTLVVHVGFQRWRQQRRNSLRRATSHTDVFTYNMVAMEFFTLTGSGLYLVAQFSGVKKMMTAGFYIFSMVLPGQAQFHCLTCIERYLAVVCPITYLSLRQSRGVRIRNISISCVWLMSFGWLYMTHVSLPEIAYIPFFSFYALALMISSFCSLSVLWALKHPSPGEKGGDRVKVDPSKQRASHTMMAIMGTLLLKFVGLLMCLLAYGFIISKGGSPCLVLKSSFWFILPSSLVSPLLFLHRVDKLPCCKSVAAAVQG